VIAFLILAHNNPSLLRRLVDRLQGPNVEIYVHLDRRVDREGFMAAAQLTGAKYVPANRSVKVHWGGFSLVLATIALMQYAVEDNKQSERFFLLSGVSYPARSRNEILSALAAPGQTIHVEHHLSVDKRGDYHSFVNRIWLNDIKWLNHREFRHTKARGAFYRLAKYFGRRPIPGFELFRGSNWWSIDRRAVEHVLFVAKNRRSIARWFYFSCIPDEMYFVSILKNSEFAREINQDWPDVPRPSGISENLYGVHYIDWKNHDPETKPPRVLTLDDLGAIRASGALFARKMDPVRSASLMDALDRMAQVTTGSQ
jgi:hypothetical protein